MRKEQRRIGEAGKVVMVGRDIGTVVLPDADLKIYLDATLHERAGGAILERQERGEQVTFEQVLADVERRDRGDSSRQHAPLKAARRCDPGRDDRAGRGQVLERVDPAGRALAP